MMSRRKKMWRGLAFAVAVAVLAEGVARMPVLEAANKENGVGTMSESAEGDSGANNSSDSAVRKSTGIVRSKDTGNVVTNTAEDEKDQDAASNTENISGDGANQIENPGEKTDSSVNGATGTDIGNNDAGGDTDGSGDDGTGGSGSGDEGNG